LGLLLTAATKPGRYAKYLEFVLIYLPQSFYAKTKPIMTFYIIMTITISPSVFLITMVTSN